MDVIALLTIAVNPTIPLRVPAILPKPLYISLFDLSFHTPSTSTKPVNPLPFAFPFPPPLSKHLYQIILFFEI